MNFIFPAPRQLNEIEPGQRAVCPESLRAGVLISQSIDGGPEYHIDLVQCKHCQNIFPYVKGSGRVRGWCMQCNGMFCGPECEVCVPAMQMIANMEAGLPFQEARQHKAIKALVVGDVPSK